MQERLDAPGFGVSAILAPGVADEGSSLWDVLTAQQAAGTIVLAGLDYLDRLKGVAPKLLAWEALLTDYPHYRKGHILVQVCVGARNRIHIKTAPAVEGELRGIVDRINSKFPGTVHFEVRSGMSSSDRLRLWCASQMLFVTALREAINVCPLEFVLARHLNGKPSGTLILSEFTGFARVLNGCLRINPNAQVELVETLDQALTMRAEERDLRAAKDLAHIQRCTNEAFAQTFLTELKSTQTKRQEDFMCVGFGHARFRLVGMGAGFKPLDTSEAVEAFQKGKKRLLLLDWGGTLAPAEKTSYETRDNALPEKVLSALAALCNDPSCHVMIMSGLDKDKVKPRGVPDQATTSMLPPPHACLTCPPLLPSMPASRALPSSPPPLLLTLHLHMRATCHRCCTPSGRCPTSPSPSSMASASVWARGHGSSSSMRSMTNGNRSRAA